MELMGFPVFGMALAVPPPPRPHLIFSRFANRSLIKLALNSSDVFLLVLHIHGVKRPEREASKEDASSIGPDMRGGNPEYHYSFVTLSISLAINAVTQLIMN